MPNTLESQTEVRASRVTFMTEIKVIFGLLDSYGTWAGSGTSGGPGMVHNGFWDSF